MEGQLKISEAAMPPTVITRGIAWNLRRRMDQSATQAVAERGLARVSLYAYEHISTNADFTNQQ